MEIFSTLLFANSFFRFGYTLDSFFEMFFENVFEIDKVVS